MKYRYIFFDLDGTLSDSAMGITKSVAFALEKFGIYENYENLGYFVGPPLADTFKEKFKMNDNEVDMAIKYFRERFSSEGIFENKPYAGVETLLADLKKAGKKLILATSKPELFAKQIIDRYGFSDYFDFIGGANMDEKTMMKKSDVMRYCVENLKLSNEDIPFCIMVGDRRYDAEGARTLNIKTVGVSYGYGTEDELKIAGVIKICKSVEELKKYLLE